MGLLAVTVMLLLAEGCIYLAQNTAQGQRKETTKIAKKETFAPGC